MHNDTYFCIGKCHQEAIRQVQEAYSYVQHFWQVDLDVSSLSVECLSHRSQEVVYNTYIDVCRICFICN